MTSIPRDAIASVNLSDVTTGETIGPIPPGEVLREEFMVPLGLSARGLARELGMPANRVTGILNGTRAITADTAIRLGERFNTTAELWMNLQTAFDLELVRQKRAA